jgi:hypothetical protein
VNVVSLSETAVLLRVRLGKLRAWYPFLTDNIAGKTDLFGQRLMPCGMQKSNGLLRPIYALEDIDRFVAHVMLAAPSAGKQPVTSVQLMLDRSRHWRLNRFDENGAVAATGGRRPASLPRSSAHV